MFYPKKKKLGDLEVEEVAELLGIPRNGDEPKKIPPSLLTPVPRIPPETLANDEQGVPLGFYPKVQEENTTNFGQGRVIENPPIAQEEPGFYPRTRPRVVPTTDETFAPKTREEPQAEPVGFYPRSELSGTIREPTQQEQLEQEYEKRRQLQTVGAPKEKSLAKRLLQGALRGFARGGIGGAMLGTAVEGFYPKANTNLRTETELAKSNRNIGDLERTQQFQSQQEMQKAQLEDVPLEREYKKDILQERKDARIAKQKETARNNFYKQNKFFSKKNATEAQKRQLAEFGETPDSIGEFDFTNPTFKKIGDSTFRWDKNENAFVDSGLPKDSSAAFTEITAVDPTDGKTYTYITTQEKAAGLLNSKVVGNMQIIAARDRQASQQSFQAQENEKNREVRREAIQVSRDRLSIANRNVELAEQRLALAQDKDKRAAQEELRKAKETRFRLKAYLKNNPLISDDVDLNTELDAFEDEQ